MRYRIKIITFKNGRKEFYPQFKGKFFWMGLNSDGEANIETTIVSLDCYSREEALKRIDKHFSGNTVKQTIEFEYFSK